MTANILAAAAAEIGGDARAIRGAYRDLSRGYRAGAPTADDRRLADGQLDAYLTARLPATAAVAEAVLRAVTERRPDWRPGSLLDLGAGPGPAAWAAAQAFPSLTRITLVEQSAAMLAAGQRMAARSDHPAIRAAWWRRDSVLAAPPEPADLVVASYVVGELAPDELLPAVTRWWAATNGELIVIEPGTPAGFERIRQVRTALLEAGGTVTAPCPSDAECPMTAGDWCHFGERIARSAGHRAAKEAGRGFEDEKFAYVAVSRLGPAHAPGRLLRVPQARSGHLRLRVCEAPRVLDVVVPRSRREDYSWARRAHWGDAVPAGLTARAGVRPTPSVREPTPSVLDQ